MRILRKTAYSCALLLLCLVEVKAYPLPTVTLGHEQGLHHIKSKQSGNIILPFGQDDRFQGLLAFEGKQYRLGGRVIQEHSGDQERFSVWGFYIDQIRLSYGHQGKKSWQRSFDYVNSGKKNRFSFSATYPNYVEDTTIHLSEREVYLGHHYMLPGAKLAYQRHIDLSRNVQLDPEFGVYAHMKHPHNWSQTKGFTGAVLALRANRLMGDSTLGSTTLQAKYDSNRNWQFSMKLALQIKGKPVGVSTATVSDMRYDKASRKLQAPSIWFGEQGFMALLSMVFI